MTSESSSLFSVSRSFIFCGRVYYLVLAELMYRMYVSGDAQVRTVHTGACLN